MADSVIKAAIIFYCAMALFLSFIALAIETYAGERDKAFRQEMTIGMYLLILIIIFK